MPTPMTIAISAPATSIAPSPMSRMIRTQFPTVSCATALRRVLDRAQVALDVQRVDAVLPFLARALLVRLRQHRLGERGRELQLSALRRQTRREKPHPGGRSWLLRREREVARRRGKIAQVIRLEEPEQEPHAPVVGSLPHALFQDLHGVHHAEYL